jgi:formiminotetrahydrofolate cyclodeaminase
MAISDAGVSVYLAEGALRAALLNVDINLPQVKDQDFVKSAEKDKEGLIRQAAEIRDRALSAISARMKGS